MSFPPFTLSDQQKQFFATFGYLGFPGLLADRADEIIDAFEGIWTAKGGGHGGKQHEGTARSCIVPFLDQSEVLSSLLDDPRIDGIAAGLLGNDYNYMGSDGNYYVGDTQWHSDGWHEETTHLKIALYLDPLTRSTGALRVIPGSHRHGDQYAESLHGLRQAQESMGITGAEVPAVALETRAGDVVCFNHNTKHASFGGNQWRRMFTINLSQRYPEERRQALRDYVNHYARFWIDQPYGEAMLRTAGPERQVHLEQLLAECDHLPALAAEARATMSEPARG